ncbi:MAG: T9SS type A sorting domain-containing protein, partial [bacterium]|nr:T9SS type A sorting domain-containing protein [bacterium]
YTAHGGVTYWVDPEFNQTDLNNLDNYGKYCLAVGNCCVTGSYGADECFGETWLRVAEKGGIGYIGASMNTSWDEDYWWGVGFHPSSEIDGSAIPYEDTGLGAYDGIFHDHGEAMTQWYITNDAIIFSGNLAVSQSGNSSANNYWTTYNLQGDPSLSLWIGTPQINPVSHVGTIFTTNMSLVIDAAPNSYCGLTKDGILVGAGTVDETGTLDMEFFTNLTPGPVHLVVMGQFMEPYITDINVIVPATITMDPTAIDVNTPTVVTIGVFESDGTTPKPGINVWAEGLGYSVPAVVSGADGYCQLTIDYNYGPSINVHGQDPADPWLLFTEVLTVNATPLRHVGLKVETEIGLANSFPLNLPGTLVAFAAFGQTLPAHDLWLIHNDVAVGSTTADEYVYTATELGTVEGIFAADGCNLVRRSYEVIEAYGTLTGTIDAAGTPAANAVIKLYDDSMEQVAEATANSAGAYDFGIDILVADYTATIDLFGYLPYEEDIFVNYGANVHDVNLVAAPAGVISGTITEYDTEIPLEATIKVYRSDNMQLMSEVQSDAVTGAYTTAGLPYFDYIVNVRAWHHMPVTMTITVDEPTIVKNFILEETIGNILVLDDGSKEDKVAKYDEKTGMMIAAGYAAEDTKSAADIVTDLEYLGFAVELENLSGSDPADWWNFDMILLSTGSNDEAVANGASLVSFVQAGGHILVEGGEVGYDHQTDAFGTQVLHITDWTADSCGDLTIEDSEHYLVSVPNVITGPISMNYGGFADEDGLVVAPDAAMVGSWTGDSNASIIAFDPNPAPEGGQIVFFAFNYSIMDAAVRSQLLQNAVTWLITTEAGNCAVSGSVTLGSETDHSGVRIEAIPNGGYTMTAADGSYTLDDLFAGPYQIRASKDDWATGAQDVSLLSGQHLSGIDFTLSRVYIDEYCSQPALAINDNQTCSDVINVDMDCTITAVEVFLDITHTFIGDLEITLESPAGTSVILHNNSGSSADDIYGWYPSTLAPDGSLDDFLGESMSGDWTLSITDSANSDTGTLNEWCVKITHDVQTGIGDVAPAVLALGKNFPNPFNPTTTITFDMPKSGKVDLAIYDVTGRRVATLVNGTVDAGQHEIMWQGKDDSGNRVASGLYFSRLISGEEMLTRKMMLLK